jgi:hypothetical protein
LIDGIGTTKSSKKPNRPKTKIKETRKQENLGKGKEEAGKVGRVVYTCEDVVDRG